jgi:hypothetical protein
MTETIFFKILNLSGTGFEFGTLEFIWYLVLGIWCLPHFIFGSLRHTSGRWLDVLDDDPHSHRGSSIVHTFYPLPGILLPSPLFRPWFDEG